MTASNKPWLLILPNVRFPSRYISAALKNLKGAGPWLKDIWGKRGQQWTSTMKTG